MWPDGPRAITVRRWRTPTHCLKILEARGLIMREPNPDDVRSILVRMTQAGRELINLAIVGRVENEKQLVEDMPAEKLE